MKKPVKSTDPRKPKLMAEFKRRFSCTKVTNVVDLGDGRYSAHCQVRSPCKRGFTSLGHMIIQWEE